MTTMVTEVYDALIAAGAPDDKARRAAEVLANYESRFSRIEAKLTLLQGISGATLALVIAMFVKLFVQ